MMCDRAISHVESGGSRNALRTSETPKLHAIRRTPQFRHENADPCLHSLIQGNKNTDVTNS